MILGDLIKEYRNKNEMSLRDFAKKCGLSHTYISALEKKYDSRNGKLIAPTLDAVKYISKAMNIPLDNFLKILDDKHEFTVNADAPKYEEPQFYMAPVYGKISAGQPNWVEECIEGRLPLDLNLMNIVNPDECFFLCVNGESMNEKIKNGAYALIRKTDYVENGEIAVVLVNGYDATLKKFSKQGDLIILEPQSTDKSIQTQVYGKDTEVKILGKYLGKMEFDD